jgi:hypothetical protein
MGQLPYLVPVPRGANTLNRRPDSAPITHNEACRKLWIASSLLHPKAVPALPFPPPGQSTCASIAALLPTARIKPLRRL